jgi:hypothetical protein
VQSSYCLLNMVSRVEELSKFELTVLLRRSLLSSRSFMPFVGSEMQEATRTRLRRPTLWTVSIFWNTCLKNATFRGQIESGV